MIRYASVELLPERKCFLLIGTTYWNMKFFFRLPLSSKKKIEQVLEIKINLSEEQIFMVPVNNNFLIELLNSKLN